jgi:hypothetical protein
MRINEILEKFDIALNALFSNDLFLLERSISERSISYKLAEYLQPLFIGYNVDCEYNGDVDKPNDIKALDITEAEIRSVGYKPSHDNNYNINPDIIIHCRGSNKNNLVVIEVKKDRSNPNYKEYDKIKLKHLTTNILGNHYNYKLGVFLELGTLGASGSKSVIYFQEGKQIEQRESLN